MSWRRRCRALAVLACLGGPAWAQDGAPTPLPEKINGDDPFVPARANPVTETPALKALIAANPGRELIICLAGCTGGIKPGVVWQRHPASVAAVATVEASGLLHAGRGLAGAQTGRANAASPPSRTPARDDAVVCLAGCNGPIGLVVWRGMRFAWIRPENRDMALAAFSALAGQLAGRELALAAEPAPRSWIGTAALGALMARLTEAEALRAGRLAHVTNVPRG